MDGLMHSFIDRAADNDFWAVCGGTLRLCRAYSRGQNCLLLVPSVLAPSENNWLINPAHPDVKGVTMGCIDPINYDQRILEKKRRDR
jgi:RES domain-containing protein